MQLERNVLSMSSGPSDVVLTPSSLYTISSAMGAMMGSIEG